VQDFDLIETPENVELMRPLAGIGSRFIAGILDNLLIAGIFLVIAILGAITFSSPAEAVGSVTGAGPWGLAALTVVAFVL
jgi:uncharacterized RDD family membrane protein YckC